MSVLVRSIFVELKVGDEKLGDGLMAGRRRRTLADVSQWKAGGGDKRGIKVDEWTEREGAGNRRLEMAARSVSSLNCPSNQVLGFAVLGVGGWVPASLELAKSYLTALTKGVTHPALSKACLTPELPPRAPFHATPSISWPRPLDSLL